MIYQNTDIDIEQKIKKLTLQEKTLRASVLCVILKYRLQKTTTNNNLKSWKFFPKRMNIFVLKFTDFYFWYRNFHFEIYWWMDYI